MKKIILLLIAVGFLAACGHAKIQKKYINAQKKLVMQQLKQHKKPMVDITTPDGTQIVVRNPHLPDVQIKSPTKHPATKVWEDTVGLASSPLASILGFGYAGKLLMEEAGAEYSAGGDMAGGDISGGDMSGGDMAGNDLSGKGMDKSDNRRDFNNDKSDNRRDFNNDKSDNRQDYNNDKSDRRNNYNNDNSMTEDTGGNGE